VHNFTVQGKGVLDGLGYEWWEREWALENPHKRPHLLKVDDSTNVTVRGIEMRNSPSWYLNFGGADTVHIDDITIDTVLFKQAPNQSKGHATATFEGMAMSFATSLLEWHIGSRADAFKALFGARPMLSWPSFPLNTDAIDFRGSNFLIENSRIKNYDDAIVPKPCTASSSGYTKDSCTQAITVRNMNITFGVGASIGSVPPAPDHTCVKDVVFEDIDFKYPLKAIYIKTNPCKHLTPEECDASTGQITDLLYNRISMYNPIWWAVYIGPQQQ